MFNETKPFAYASRVDLSAIQDLPDRNGVVYKAWVLPKRAESGLSMAGTEGRREFLRAHFQNAYEPDSRSLHGINREGFLIQDTLKANLSEEDFNYFTNTRTANATSRDPSRRSPDTLHYRPFYITNANGKPRIEPYHSAYQETEKVTVHRDAPAKEGRLYETLEAQGILGEKGTNRLRKSNSGWEVLIGKNYQPVNLSLEESGWAQRLSKKEWEPLSPDTSRGTRSSARFTIVGGIDEEVRFPGGIIVDQQEIQDSRDRGFIERYSQYAPLFFKHSESNKMQAEIWQYNDQSRPPIGSIDLSPNNARGNNPFENQIASRLKKLEKNERQDRAIDGIKLYLKEENSASNSQFDEVILVTNTPPSNKAGILAAFAPGKKIDIECGQDGMVSLKVDTMRESLRASFRNEIGEVFGLTEPRELGVERAEEGQREGQREGTLDDNTFTTRGVFTTPRPTFQGLKR